MDRMGRIFGVGGPASAAAPPASVAARPLCPSDISPAERGKPCRPTAPGIPLRSRFARSRPLSFRKGTCLYLRSHPVVCSGLLPGLPRGWPGSQGLRSRKDRSSPRALVPAPGPRLLPSPSPLRVAEKVDPGEGSDAAQSVLQTASFRFPARLASPDRGHGSRLDDWGRRSDCAAFLGSALPGLHSRCSLPPAADRSRFMSAPRTGLPALGTASPRPLCPSDISPAQRGKPWDEGGGTDAGWLALRRRTYAPRSGNFSSHASARPSRPCTGFPIR